LYPLGACNPARKIFSRSESGTGRPSKLGVALRSAIAWDSDFSIRFASQQALLNNALHSGLFLPQGKCISRWQL
jgi:hypothetical protein